MKKRWIAAAAAVVLLLGCVAGGSLAWLIDRTQAKVNTFTVGNIEIALEETAADYKMVPGCTIAKDPTVSVTAESEACWLFVKVTESDNLDDFIAYTMADGWTALTGVDGVYYRQVTQGAGADGFAVLADDQVMVKNTVTKDMMGGLTAQTYPQLTFTAYAVQYYDGSDNGQGHMEPAEAWALIANP